MYYEWIKHIDMKFHFSKEVVDDEIVEIVKIPSYDNVLDMLTKILAFSKFQHCLELRW